MPRPPRLHVPGGLYHAVLRGNHRQAIFDGGSDYRCFEEILAAALERYGASLFAYCWMKNHVHLAVRVAEAPLGEVMRIVASRYARRRQWEIATTGHLFERRFRARLVDADGYLLALVRYVHLNPIRAGIVADPCDYPWSSHRAYLGAPQPDWLCTRPVLDILGASATAARAAYRKLMGEQPSAAELEKIGMAPRADKESRTRQEAPAPMPHARASARAGRNLDAITAEVGAELGLAVGDLHSRRRHRELVQARVEVARRALREGVASLSQVAQHFGRVPSTLSGLLYGRR